MGEKSTNKEPRFCTLENARLHPLRVFILVLTFLLVLMAIAIPLYLTYATAEYTSILHSPPFTNVESYTPLTNNPVQDNVKLVLKLSNADLVNHLITLRTRIYPTGNLLEQNIMIANGNLSILLDAVLRRFPVEYAGSAPTPIAPFDASVVVQGDANLYPFDVHTARFVISGFWNDNNKQVVPIVVDFENLASSYDVSVEMTRPNAAHPAPITGTGIKTTTPPESAGLDVVIAITLTRTTAQKVFSMFTMLLMWLLSLTVLMLAIDSMLTLKRVELPILALCTAMMFALPALRNSQPLVPPIGTLGDVCSFLFAELIISSISIGLIIFYISQAAKKVVVEEKMDLKKHEDHTTSTAGLIMGGEMANSGITPDAMISSSIAIHAM